MLTSTHVVAAAGLLFAGALASGAAQSAPAKTPAARAAAPITTASGVYTAAQAAKGEQVYMAFCVSCHPAGTYAAREFRDKWHGAPLSTLFDLVIDTMPKSEPGSLDLQAYVDVISYILKVNGAPPGKTPLSAAAHELRKIRLHLPRR